MRALLVLVVLAFGSSCDDPGAEIVISNVTRARLANGGVGVDFDATAVEHAGRDVGSYCVSVHWLSASDLSVTDPAPAYVADVEVKPVCGPAPSSPAKALHDGDTQHFHIESDPMPVLAPGAPLRVQGQVDERITTSDTDNP
jgi:hypothetical protein